MLISESPVGGILNTRMLPEGAAIFVARQHDLSKHKLFYLHISSLTYFRIHPLTPDIERLGSFEKQSKLLYDAC